MTMKVNFNLKTTVKVKTQTDNSDDKTEKNNKSKSSKLIFIVLYINGKRLKWSTGQKIELKQWDTENQFPKAIKGTSELRNLLTDYKAEVNKYTMELLTSKSLVTVAKVKTHLDNYTNKTERNDKMSFIEHLADYIELNKTQRKATTLKIYSSLKKHLTEYEEHTKQQLTFEGIDINFYDRFTLFLTKDYKINNDEVRKGIQTVSISKYIRSLKAFLNWLTERGINKYTYYKKFKSIGTTQNIIHLSKEEVMLLHTQTFTPAYLDRAKDLFVFSCFTGLRYSDLQQVNKDRINKDNTLVITMYKTNEEVRIPLTEVPLAILKKYDFELPVISNQKVNVYLKDCARIAELNDSVELLENRGNNIKRVNYKKCEVLSFHDSRKTFVTLAMLSGMKVETIMKITGHKQHSVFLKYLEITEETKQNEMKIFQQSFK